MSELPNLKIDIWWKAILVLGLLACFGAAAFEIDFLERKHLFGFGLGMILVGIGFWKCWIKSSEMLPNGRIKTDHYNYDIISVLLIITGVLMIGLFGYLIVKGLI
jgi:hypothetical protein